MIDFQSRWKFIYLVFEKYITTKKQNKKQMRKWLSFQVWNNG